MKRSLLIITCFSVIAFANNFTLINTALAKDEENAVINTNDDNVVLLTDRDILEKKPHTPNGQKIFSQWRKTTNR